MGLRMHNAQFRDCAIALVHTIFPMGTIRGLSAQILNSAIRGLSFEPNINYIIVISSWFLINAHHKEVFIAQKMPYSRQHSSFFLY